MRRLACGKRSEVCGVRCIAFDDQCFALSKQQATSDIRHATDLTTQ